MTADEILSLLERPAWQAYAECRGLGPKRFYPGQGAQGQDVDKIKAICRSCPVREECLDYAINRPEEYGIWGGLSGRQLQRERARRRRQERAA